MRKIYCPDCGKLTPTHPEDAARNLFPRRTRGHAIHDMLCDACGKEIPKGAVAVAESVPCDMAFWESDFIESKLLERGCPASDPNTG